MPAHLVTVRIATVAVCVQTDVAVGDMASLLVAIRKHPDSALQLLGSSIVLRDSVCDKVS